MLLNKGTFRGRKFFSPDIVSEMYTNQLEEIEESSGLGWELNQQRYMGKHATSQTFGKTGFTGCVVVCDVQSGVGIVMLSNYTYPKRKSSATFINQKRREIIDIVLENI